MNGRGSRGHLDERGSASVHAAWVMMALSFVAITCLGIASIFLAQRRAQTAADLAALAGATAVQQGHPGCAVAARISARNGAQLAQCGERGEIVSVRATVRVPRMLGEWSVTGTARAGPVGLQGGSQLHPW